MSNGNCNPDADIEQWLPVVGFEAFYLVSNLGNVKRIGAIAGAKVGRILKQRKTGNGYVQVHLCKNGTIHNKSVHLLVLEAFIGFRHFDIQINHIDGNKANNRLNNLEYCTSFENMQHASQTGLLKPLKGELSPSAVMTEVIVLEIIELLKNTKMPIAEIARKFNLKYNTVYNIKMGTRWKHLNSQEIKR